MYIRARDFVENSSRVGGVGWPIYFDTAIFGGHPVVWEVELRLILQTQSGRAGHRLKINHRALITRSSDFDQNCKACLSCVIASTPARYGIGKKFDDESINILQDR